MAMMINEAALEERLRQERAACGADRYDEVWEGVYMMAPMPNNDHQRIVGRLTRVLDEIVTDRQLGEVFPGANVSDRVEDWDQNYRVPDVAVFLKHSQAVNHGTFWFGGPDFAVEVVSPNDQSRDKLDFYGKVKTRELLIIDREPWQLELFRHQGSQMVSVASATSADGMSITSKVLPLEVSLRLVDHTPRVYVVDPSTNKSWTL